MRNTIEIYAHFLKFWADYHKQPWLLIKLKRCDIKCYILLFKIALKKLVPQILPPTLYLLQFEGPSIPSKSSGVQATCCHTYVL
jgi:hypothetical protein